MEKEFARVRSGKDIAIIISIIVCGGVLIALKTSDAVNITGFFLIITGLILSIFLRTGYKDVETGMKFKKKERYFPIDKREALLEYMKNGKKNIDLSDEDKGNGLRLDIYHNKKSGLAYVRLYEYVPYKYEPCSKPKEFTYEDAKSLL